MLKSANIWNLRDMIDDHAKDGEPGMAWHFKGFAMILYTFRLKQTLLTYIIEVVRVSNQVNWLLKTI